MSCTHPMSSIPNVNETKAESNMNDTIFMTHFGEGVTVRCQKASTQFWHCQPKVVGLNAPFSKTNIEVQCCLKFCIRRKPCYVTRRIGLTNQCDTDCPE